MDIKTSCKDCVFANHGKCKLGRYKNFEKNGATIEKDEAGNMTVKGRYCSALRKKQWEEGKNRHVLDVFVRAELLTSTEVFIYINEENYSEASLLKTLADLNSQLLKPSMIVFIVNDDNFKFAKLIKIGNESGFNFRVDRVLSNGEGVKMHELDATDIAARKTTSDFILLMHPGSTLEDNEFFANVDEAINEKLMRFSVIMPNRNCNRGIMASTALYKKLDGNAEMSTLFIDPENGNKETILHDMESKIYYLVHKDNHYEFCRTYEEIKNG